MTHRDGWPSSYVEHQEGSLTMISVVLSWHLEKAIARRDELLRSGVPVVIGGPATRNGASFKGVLSWHNPNATRTSYGCPNKCPFCIVSEDDLVELDDWEPKPIVIDDNLLATSKRHFDSVIDRLKPVHGVDTNQGLDARIMTSYHASRLAELDMRMVRISWDWTKDESHIMRAIELLRVAGFPKSKITVFALIGFRDSPEDALYRLETIRSMGIKPFPMRFQPLDTKKRNEYVGLGWTNQELIRYCRYWANLRYVSKVPFSEFQYPNPAKETK